MKRNKMKPTQDGEACRVLLLELRWAVLDALLTRIAADELTNDELIRLLALLRRRCPARVNVPARRFAASCANVGA